MYSSLKNIQILVTLLKKYGVKHIVISAGTRHTPFVYSVEQDSFFTTYSIVDERSASFFAIGLIEKLREPVAICCTSGTAAANYVSAANEAFYQQLPLLLLTADRNHYYMFQQEEQMIPQENLYAAVCKKVVTLPHVRDDKDFWYCARICNEALMELHHGEDGPVHINFIVENDYPIVQGIVKFETKILPDVRKINRLTLESSNDVWKKWADIFVQSKILIIYGQYKPLDQEEIANIEAFSRKYNCVISVDLLSNLHTTYTISTYSLSKGMSKEQLEELSPDILITMNGNSISEMKSRMGIIKERFRHIHVSAKGAVSDPLKCLSDVIECTPQTFFKRFAEIIDSDETDHNYYKAWCALYTSYGNRGSLNDVEIPYSSMYANQQLLKNMPTKSLLHLANSNTVRLANYFNVQDGIEVYGNRGTHGIDGSMSAFIGQAYVSGMLSFLIIGDLSFFYDMNALWNQYIGSNIRILVCNNSGGAIFHTYPNTNNIPTLDEHIAAEHHTSVREWSVARGFEYISATDKNELDKAIQKLIKNNSTHPILVECFTDKDVDAKCIKDILTPYTPEDTSLKHMVGKMLPNELKQKIHKYITKTSHTNTVC